MSSSLEKRVIAYHNRRSNGTESSYQAAGGSTGSPRRSSRSPQRSPLKSPARSPQGTRRQALYSGERKGRGSTTKGWGAEAPRRGTARHELYQKCGSKCFLNPKEEKFPICSKSCDIDCRGVHAAYQRARQYKHEDIAEKASSLLKRDCASSPGRSKTSSPRSTARKR
jgi:hypothetical protein